MERPLRPPHAPAARSQVQIPGRHPGSGASAHVLRLQRDAGNAAVTAQLQPVAVQRDLFTGSQRWTLRDELIMASQIGPDVIDGHANARVRPAVDRLSDGDWTTFRALLDDAPTWTHRAFLCKALAANRSVADIKAFATKIKDHNVRWLKDNCNVVEEETTITGQSTTGLSQQFQMSCGATTVQIIRAQADPIYALSLHEGGDIHAQPNQGATGVAWPSLPTGANATVMNEQGKILGAHGSVPTPLGTAGVGAWVEDTLSGLSAATGLKYKFIQLGKASPITLPTGFELELASLTILIFLSLNRHVPIVVGDATHPDAHYMVALRRDQNRIQIHNPANGKTFWIAKSQITSNTIPDGWTHLWGYSAPESL